MRLAAGIALSLVAGVVGCTGSIDGGDDDSSGDPVTLSFVTPTASAALVRDTLEPVDGWRAAMLDVELAITGTPVSIELAAGELALGAAEIDGASGRGQVTLIESGAVTLTATAKDAAGAALATATVEVMVGDPTPASCRAWLDLYGITYTVGPNNAGVTDPVTVTTPINGLIHRSSSSTNPRATFFMDCTLARSLVLAAPHMRSRDIVEVADMGVYNYRCIGGGTPPDCPNGISQHAYAKGIDIAGVKDSAGVYYSVNDDWVIDPDAEKTCEAATSNAKDAFLHELICAIKADKVWNIVLTPNYNADHRNHFHVDLTTGSDYINKPGAGHRGDEPTTPAIDGHYEIDRAPDLH